MPDTTKTAASTGRGRRHLHVLPRNYVIVLAMAQRLWEKGAEPFTSYDIVYEIHETAKELDGLAAARGETFDEARLQMAGTTLDRALHGLASADEPLLAVVGGEDARVSRRNLYRTTQAGRERAEREVVTLAARTKPPWPPLLATIQAVLRPSSRRGATTEGAAPGDQRPSGG